MGQISAPVRIVALVGLLGALAMGAWVMTAGMRGGAAGQQEDLDLGGLAGRMGLGCGFAASCRDNSSIMRTVESLRPTQGRFMRAQRVWKPVGVDKYNAEIERLHLELASFNKRIEELERFQSQSSTVDALKRAH